MKFENVMRKMDKKIINISEKLRVISINQLCIVVGVRTRYVNDARFVIYNSIDEKYDHNSYENDSFHKFFFIPIFILFFCLNKLGERK